MPRTVIEPPPAFPRLDGSNHARLHAEPRCSLPLQFFPFQGENLLGKRFRYLDLRVLLATIVGSMDATISLVLSASFPGQVPLGDTAKMAFAARVGSFVFRSRSRPIGFFAEESGDEPILVATKHHPVAFVIFGVRPCQAFVSLIREDNGVEILLHLTALRAFALYCGRISMLTKPLVVHFAETLGVVGIPAIWYGAKSSNSHCKASHE